jgi:hypothetical protein
MNWTRRCRSAVPSRRGPRIDDRWAENEELRLTPLPIRGFERLSSIRRFLDECVRAIEREARLTYRAVLGVRGVCAQRPQRRPARPERSPAPWCHTTVQALRHEFMERYRAFVTSFLAASQSWRGGNLAARFPGTAVRPFLWPGEASVAPAG